MAMQRIVKKCPICHVSTSVIIPAESYAAYVSGKCIQEAWPEGTTTEREILISGICPACQDGVFNE